MAILKRAGPQLLTGPFDNYLYFAAQCSVPLETELPSLIQISVHGVSTFRTILPLLEVPAKIMGPNASS